jgi:hypothetical protein
VSTTATGTITRFEVVRITSKSSSEGGFGVGVGFGVGGGGGGGRSLTTCALVAGIKKKRANTPHRSAGPRCLPQISFAIIKPSPQAAIIAG